MSKPHAISALEKKRAALKGETRRLDMLRAKAAESIRHIDATLAFVRERPSATARPTAVNGAGYSGAGNSGG